MAAQPLVRRSFAFPSETYETNVMGTVNLLDAVRACESVRAVVVVTSDKCYENRDSRGGYREADPLGGHDPYSSSKAAAELVTSAYRRSFFSTEGAPRVATARAGNVIGGGDWGEDRLIPDVVRAGSGPPPGVAGIARTHGTFAAPTQPFSASARGSTCCARSPAYLLLAEALCESPDYARAWNFGPAIRDARTVEWVVRHVSDLWPGGVPWQLDESEHPQRRFARAGLQPGARTARVDVAAGFGGRLCEPRWIGTWLGGRRGGPARAHAWAGGSFGRLIWVGTAWV